MDADELKNLLKVVTRPNVKEFITKEINRLNSFVNQISTQEGPNTLQKERSVPGKFYSEVKNYGRINGYFSILK